MRDSPKQQPAQSRGSYKICLLCWFIILIFHLFAAALALVFAGLIYNGFVETRSAYQQEDFFMAAVSGLFLAALTLSWFGGVVWWLLNPKLDFGKHLRTHCHGFIRKASRMNDPHLDEFAHLSRGLRSTQHLCGWAAAMCAVIAVASLAALLFAESRGTGGNVVLLGMGGLALIGCYLMGKASLVARDADVPPSVE